MENENKKIFQSGYTKGMGFGLILMLIGVLFLSFNFGLLPSELKRIVFTWPMILVFFGIVNWFKRKPFSGTILLSIGLFFLFPRIISVYPEYFPGINGSFTHTYWPLLLIVGGLLLILSKMFGNKWGMAEWSVKNNDHKHKHKHYHNYTGPNTGFERNSIFSAGEHIVLEPEFKGGELNAIFGGITLDLRKTSLPEGETWLEINAVFGGVTIIVPENWHIETNIDAVFGGFEDKRNLSDRLDAGRKLKITGACVFGGGELKN